MIIIIIIIISHLHNLRSASWLWRISRGVWSQSETVKCFEYHNNVKHGRRTFWRKSAWPGNQSPCYFFFCSSSSRLKFKVCDKIFTKNIYFYHLIFFFFSTLVYSGQCQIVSYCQSLLSSCNIINNKKIVSTHNKLFYTDLRPLRDILPERVRQVMFMKINWLEIEDFAHSWEILLAREDKIRITKRPCNVLFIL